MQSTGCTASSSSASSPERASDNVVAVAAQRVGELVEIGFAVVDGQDLAAARAGSRPDRRRSARRAAQHGGEPGEDDGDVFLLADEGVGAGIERAQFGAAFLGGGEQQAGHRPRSAASSRIRRITVAPSMPGSTPSTTIAFGRVVGDAASPSSPVAGVSTR